MLKLGEKYSVNCGGYVPGRMEQKTDDGDSSSYSNLCPICLGPVNGESYLDQCFHKFCYNCILHWRKVVANKCSVAPPSVKCPLCKVDNFSIIQCCDGIPYRKHYVNQDPWSSDFFTEAHKYRLQCYYCDTGCLSEIFNVQRYWKLHKYVQPNRWLLDWTRREIQALTQEEDVEIIVHHILGIIESFRRNEQKKSRPGSKMPADEIKRDSFKNLVAEAGKGFLTGRNDRFVNELEMFLASELNINAYDKVYVQHLGSKISGVTDDVDEELTENTPRVVPCLHLFDEDSDNI